MAFQLVLESCTLRALDLYFKFAILQLELVLQRCDFPARAGNLYFAYHKVAIFQLELEPCTSRARLVLQCRDFPARSGTLYFLRVLDLYYKVAIFQLELEINLYFAY